MKKTLLFSTFFLISIFAKAQNADAIVGTWFTAGNESKIQVSKQGNAYIGKIVWLKEPLNKAGKAKIDDKNSDEKLKNRPLIGLVVLNGIVYESGNAWTDGNIYDPKNGKTYSCNMTLKDKNTIDLRGYIGISLIGRTSRWTRAE